jgi:HPt (histidine-containing phosphotransfer) domain-containing protein
MVDEQLFSLRQLEELASGSEDFVQSMIETFIEHSPKQVHDVVEAYENRNYKAMGDAAHKIKPSLDLFEIKGLKDVIRRIEKQGRHGDVEPTLAKEIALFRDTTIAAIEAMKSSIQEEPTEP